MADNDFNIRTFDDLYKAIGEIIELSQDLEHYYMKCAELLEIDIDKLNAQAMNRINGVLYSENKITKQDFDNLKKSNEEYVYLIHEFFWDSSLSEDLNLMNSRLNRIYKAISQSCNALENFIDEFNSSYQYF